MLELMKLNNWGKYRLYCEINQIVGEKSVKKVHFLIGGLEKAMNGACVII